MALTSNAAANQEASSAKLVEKRGRRRNLVQKALENYTKWNTTL